MLQLFLLLLLLYTAGLLNALISFIPLVFSFVVYVFNSQWPESPCLSLVHLIKTTGVILRICLTGAILLKLENYITWTWTTTFWPLWCALAVLSILALFAFALVFYSLYETIRRKMTWETLLSSVWAFIVIGGFASCSMYSALSVVFAYDSFSSEGSSSSSRRLLYNQDFPTDFRPLIVVICYFSHNVIFTLLFKSSIANFIEKLLYTDELVFEGPPPALQRAPGEPPQRAV